MAEDPTYPLIPIINFLGLFLVLVAFSLNSLQKWNTGICMFAIYVSVMCLLVAIDAIVWSDNDNIFASVWCDIVSHFIMASRLGIPACSLVISRRLCKIITRRSLMSDRKNKRKELIVDLCITVGFPAVYAGLYYIVQGVRFQVYGGLGCAAALFNSGLTIILCAIWPIVIPAISILFYSPRILWAFYRQRKEVNEFLDSSQTIGRSDYFRVLILGCLDSVVMLPIGVYILISEVVDHSIPFWPGYSYVHSDWEAISVPESAWSSNISSALQTRYDEVVYSILAVTFFLLFGSTKQARANYQSAIYFVLRPLGVQPRSKGEANIISAIDFGTSGQNPPGSIAGATSGLSVIERGTSCCDFAGTESVLTSSCIKTDKRASLYP